VISLAHLYSGYGRTRFDERADMRDSLDTTASCVDPSFSFVLAHVFKLAQLAQTVVLTATTTWSPLVYGRLGAPKL
jgi:hypothetical protein